MATMDLSAPDQPDRRPAPLLVTVADLESADEERVRSYLATRGGSVKTPLDGGSMSPWPIRVSRARGHPIAFVGDERPIALWP